MKYISSIVALTLSCVIVAGSAQAANFKLSSAAQAQDGAVSVIQVASKKPKKALENVKTVRKSSSSGVSSAKPKPGLWPKWRWPWKKKNRGRLKCC